MKWCANRNQLSVSIVSFFLIFFAHNVIASRVEKPLIKPSAAAVAEKPTYREATKNSEATKMVMAPVKLLVADNDSVVVKGYRGKFVYVVNDQLRDVTVQVSEIDSGESVASREDWQFSIKKNDNEIQAFIEGPISKQSWNEILLSGRAPGYFLKITGPSLPLTVVWNEGDISVADLNADLQVSVQKARVTVLRGVGDIRVNSIEGAVQLEGRKGEVHIDTYQSVVTVNNVEGRLDLENFTGESKVQGVNGNVALSTYRGGTRVSDVKGKLEFKNGVSPLFIEKFEGELRGRSGQGAIYADVRGEADVRLESAEGTVNLRLPASGAWVNLGTEEGDLAVPGFLKLTRMQSRQIRTGRLKGSNSGSVFVRTTSGDIRIK